LGEWYGCIPFETLLILAIFRKFTGTCNIECNENRAASLVFNEDAVVLDVKPRAKLRDYMTVHYLVWLAFAKEMEVECDDLIFITGYDRTVNWFAAAFYGEQKKFALSLGGAFPTPDGASVGASVDFSSARSYCQTPFTTWGPQEYGYLSSPLLPC